MSHKDAGCENRERVQGIEKLTGNANDGKHIRKSCKSQQGGNEHKESANFECNAESKAIEWPKPTKETAKQKKDWSKRKDQNQRSKK
jgi:hypothetical protein